MKVTVQNDRIGITEIRVVDQLPADSPSKSSLSRALRLIYRAIDEVWKTLVVDGVRSRVDPPTNLEKAFADLGYELLARRQLRMCVMGSPMALDPALQEQVYLIGREALVNALRHSGARVIDVEIEYLPSRLRVVVRDNGSGIDPKTVESGRNSHLGLAGMHERAENIGAQLHIWSRKDAGTEVEISLPNELAVATGST